MQGKVFENEHFKQGAAKINRFEVNREVEKLFKRAKGQKTTLKQINSTRPDKTPIHFKNHFNPEDQSQIRTPDEMSEEGLPDFVEELRRISDKCLINDLPPSNEEIQKHLKNLKANKASNDVEPELLNKLNSHPIMLQIIHHMTTSLWED